jgi:hypothetical protein
MSPQTHIAAAKWMIQEIIDDLWIINLKISMVHL